MSKTNTLSELQIKRRELENQLASLSKKEKTLENDLGTLEEEIIDQLKGEIESKKSALSSLESRKSDLEKKLSELRGRPAGSQKTKEYHAKDETGEPTQQNNSERNEAELTVVAYQPEQIQETEQKTKKDDKRNWVF